MCSIVRTEHYERIYESMAELAGLVGGAGRVHVHDGYEYEPEVCLCGVDVSRTLAEAGIPFRYDDGLGEWIISEPPAT